MIQILPGCHSEHSAEYSHRELMNYHDPIPQQSFENPDHFISHLPTRQDRGRAVRQCCYTKTVGSPESQSEP